MKVQDGDISYLFSFRFTILQTVLVFLTWDIRDSNPKTSTFWAPLNQVFPALYRFFLSFTNVFLWACEIAQLQFFSKCLVFSLIETDPTYPPRNILRLDSPTLNSPEGCKVLGSPNRGLGPSMWVKCWLFSQYWFVPQATGEEARKPGTERARHRPHGGKSMDGFLP